MAQAISTSLPTNARTTPADDEHVRTTAATQVSNITELLEQILSHLPMRDVLLAQIVNTNFTATISNSTNLQKAVFNAPELANSSQHVRFNPLLRHMPIFAYGNIQVPLSGPGLPHGYSEPLDRITSEPGRFRVQNEDFTLEAWKWPHQVTSLAPPKRGSWRNMHLTQPPCNVLLHVWKRDRVYTLPKRIYTMGELANVLAAARLGTRTRLEVAVEEPVSEFCVQLESGDEQSAEGSLTYDGYRAVLFPPSESLIGVLDAAHRASATGSALVHWIEDMREYEFEGSGSESGQSGSRSYESCSRDNESGSEAGDWGSEAGDGGSESGESEGGDDEDSESGESESGCSESDDGWETVSESGENDDGEESEDGGESEVGESEDGEESGGKSRRIVSFYSYHWSRDGENGSDDGQSESAGFGCHIEDDSGSESGDENEVWMARRRVIYGYYYYYYYYYY